MPRASDDIPRHPSSKRVMLAVLGVVAVALAVLGDSVLHPPIGHFRTIRGEATTTLRLSAGDRYTVYGRNWGGDICTLAPDPGATLRPAGPLYVFGQGSARYELSVTSSGTYGLSCNLYSFGDSPLDLSLGPDPTTVTMILVPFFPGIPLLVVLACLLIWARRHRAENLASSTSRSSASSS